MSWTPPPNWPPPPSQGWTPHAGWTPDPAWGPAPAGWNFYPKDTRSWPRRHPVWTGVLAVVALLAIIGGISSAIGGSKKAPVALAASSANPTPSGVESSAPAPVPTPTNTQKSKAQVERAKMVVWVDAYGTKGLAELSRDVRKVQTAAGDEDVTELGLQCEAFKIDVESFQNDPSAPVASIRHPLNAALTEFARSAVDCINGSTTSDASLINEAGSEIQRGTADLVKADRAVTRLKNS